MLSDECEKAQRGKMPRSLASLVGDWSWAALTAGEEVSPVVAHAGEVTRNIAPVRENIEKDHTVESRHRPSEKDMRAPAGVGKKARNAPVTTTNAIDVVNCLLLLMLSELLTLYPKAGRLSRI